MPSRARFVLLLAFASAAPWRRFRRQKFRVTSIEVEGARVLPREIVARAVRASDLVGRDLRTDDGRGAARACIGMLNEWYRQQGVDPSNRPWAVPSSSLFGDDGVSEEGTGLVLAALSESPVRPSSSRD